MFLCYPFDRKNGLSNTNSFSNLHKKIMSTPIPVSTSKKRETMRTKVRRIYKTKQTQIAKMPSNKKKRTVKLDNVIIPEEFIKDYLQEDEYYFDFVKSVFENELKEREKINSFEKFPFLEQRQLVLDFLILVCKEYNISKRILYSSIHMLDIFLSNSFKKPAVENDLLNKIYFTAITILLVTFKMDMSRKEKANFRLTDASFTLSIKINEKFENCHFSIKQLEMDLFTGYGKYRWKFFPCTDIFYFTRHFSSIAILSIKSLQQKRIDFIRQVSYFAAMAMNDYAIKSKYKLSLIAACVVFISICLITKKKIWTRTLIHYTRTRATDMNIIYFDILQICKQKQEKQEPGPLEQFFNINFSKQNVGTS